MKSDVSIKKTYTNMENINSDTFWLYWMLIKFYRITMMINLHKKSKTQLYTDKD